jgi:hypothetical protein
MPCIYRPRHTDAALHEDPSKISLSQLKYPGEKIQNGADKNWLLAFPIGPHDPKNMDQVRKNNG